MRNPYQPSKSEIRLTSILHALSDPNRLRIVQCLGKRKESHCSYYQTLNVSKSTLSHHFKVLREAGVIKVRIEGTQHFYSLRIEDLEELFPGLLSAVVNVNEELL
ncbi:metalloregulator ArsR/SmtB family transcription factor [Priestia flexa]|jgi:DNA-binding transcriptional ArsR family regulator|uniref:ArsR family transcriptional regulator n=2 Tax=Priestia TaxID=2800373 RepID=A0A0V8JQK8_9BACI|nr:MULTISPECIES: metalloregulator ArsR/SmtB family transcription factor [Bacillaceae]AQX54503.1 transcriptional regulator [Priestia flexa]KSU89339.1 ArsR family transcriptional regulator [Priestia veravalensis]KZB93360.1 transcriptional regulator [Bacillus sp. VT 712]MBY6085564.1 metalloregulator ArsR/SmtB family transcription factor [Priestia flexa]MCA1203819.1 metalloregulator ArsR/SmtB family transcription factor [Priestia flexa]